MVMENPAQASAAMKIQTGRQEMGSANAFIKYPVKPTQALQQQNKGIKSHSGWTLSDPDARARPSVMSYLSIFTKQDGKVTSDKKRFDSASG